jgi:ABC-2 type transport system ATP-binding protein
MDIRKDAEILTINNLRKEYKTSNNKKLSVLKDINLHLSKGITAIVGPNGAGKTTLIKSCTDLLTYEGDIFYFGENLQKMNKTKKSLMYAALSEGTRNIYWKLTPLENIRYFAALRGIAYKKIKGLSSYLLNELSLYEKRNELIENLSRGMQQKVAIVCALAMNTKIVFLDEPTLGLDVESIINMSYFLTHNEFLKEKLILISSHDFSFIENTSEKVFKLQDGMIIEKIDKKGMNNSYIVKVKHSSGGLLQQLQYEVIESNGQYCFVRVCIPYYELWKVIEHLNKEGFNVIEIKCESVDIKNFYFNKTNEL